MCPGTELKYLCESDDPAALYTIWKLPRGECNATNLNLLSDGIRLLRTNNPIACANVSGTCGRFIATNTGLSTDRTYCTSSVLTVKTSVDMDGSEITCIAYVFGQAFTSSISAIIQIASTLRQKCGEVGKEGREGKWRDSKGRERGGNERREEENGMKGVEEKREGKKGKNWAESLGMNCLCLKASFQRHRHQSYHLTLVWIIFSCKFMELLLLMLQYWHLTILPVFVLQMEVLVLLMGSSQTLTTA